MGLLGIFSANNDTADLMFLIALIVFWIVGVVTLIQNSPAWPQALAWIAAGFLALGFLFITP